MKKSPVNKLKLRRGSILVNSMPYEFSIIKYSEKWVEINLHYDGNIVSQHTIPTKLEGRKFRTSGNWYEIITPADVYR